MTLLIAAAAALLVAPATASAARVNYRTASATAPAAEKNFFDQGGLVLRGKCEAGTLTVWARTRFNDAAITGNVQRSGAPTERALGLYNFNSGSANQVELTNGAYLGSLNAATGQLVYARPGGVNVTVDYMADDMQANLFGTGKVCAFTGHAKVVSSGSSSRVNFRSNDPAPPSSPTFFSGGGLSLRAGPATSCSGGSGLDVKARTSSSNSLIYWAGQYPNTNVYSEEDPGFQTGQGDEQTLTGGGLDSFSSNHLVYARPSGNKDNVSVDWGAIEAVSNDLLGSNRCAFFGSARVAPAGSSHRVNFRAADGQLSLTKFFQSGGLQLWGRCNSSLTPQLYVIARTTVANSAIRFNGQQAQTGAATGGSPDFDPGEEPDLFAQMSGFDTSSAGQILYSNPEGRNVTVDFSAVAAGQPFNQTKECAFVGTAEKNTP